MKILYCDCFSGISGDMFLAAMLDAGLTVKYLSDELAKLGLSEFISVKTRKVMKGAIQASSLEFELSEQIHTQTQESTTENNHAHHHHHDRNLGNILSLIQSSDLSQQVKQTSETIFRKLAEAEARVHGTSIEDVHFHEVGAVDSILDIVGAALALEYFQIDQVFCSDIPFGSGTVQTQHGLLPLPAPATLELLKTANAVIVPSPAKKELVTPTGAAILASLAQFNQPEMKITHIGMGAGYADLPWPNVLRLVFGEQGAFQELHVEIETNIDDMNPQFYAMVMQHLFDHGALDVYITPIQMKKNRPAHKISVIAEARNEEVLSQILLRETSTLGVRVKALKRHEAAREIRRVNTQYGSISVKVKILENKIVQANPEYEDCLSLAESLHLPVIDVYREAQIAASSLIT